MTELVQKLAESLLLPVENSFSENYENYKKSSDFFEAFHNLRVSIDTYPSPSKVIEQGFPDIASLKSELKKSSGILILINEITKNTRVNYDKGTVSYLGNKDYDSLIKDAEDNFEQLKNDGLIN